MNAATLIDHARRAEARAPGPCGCTKTPLDGWQSQPLSLDETQLREIGTLAPENDPEPTFSEYLPGKTNYWSADAPIAPRYFPYNRCGVWECSVCGLFICATRKAAATSSIAGFARCARI
ncbi:hypothetical protein AWB66_03342 [Caballeronia telluris]|uniref:Uncharacterized protein n=1 Tax=Caballeronia telluris TaxID=326475 RepID=A0A158ITA3_9BURK|nr:hypothetical protein AWB66_03342 [Caballeronia telluris]